MIKAYYTVSQDKSRENEKRMTEKLIAYALAKENIKEYRFTHGESGKPELKGTPYFVSISHKEGTVAVAISEKNLGIDVENYREISDGVAGRIMSDEEYSAYEKCGCKTEYFYRLFTSKEAYSKYLGTGLQFVLSGDEVKLKTVFCEKECAGVKYLFAVCGDEDFCEKNLIFVPYTEL